MNRNKPYQYPPAAFQTGEKVRFYLSDDKDKGNRAYTVAASDHCFTWIDGFPHQISNWRLKRVSTRKRQKIED